VVRLIDAGDYLVAAGAAIPLRWPGRGPLWPVIACIGLFALVGAQIAIGFARMLALHVPRAVRDGEPSTCNGTAR
jgi:hypothetical protein